ncbi:MAG: hypothetical protein SGJ27_28655 [Candidatus Melainabacteria bacterium]|nr:hypothetical protein [Candidatus Melainabacteria bacterium]
MKQIQTTVALGLLLLLNNSSIASAEDSFALRGITGGAAANPVVKQDQAEQIDDVPAEVLLTISGPAKTKKISEKETRHQLILQDAKEDVLPASAEPTAPRSAKPTSARWTAGRTGPTSAQRDANGKALATSAPPVVAKDALTTSAKPTATGDERSISAKPTATGYERSTSTKSTVTGGALPTSNADSTPNQIAQRVPNGPNNFGLSDMTTDLAKQWNVFDQIVQLDVAYKEWKASGSTDNTIKYLMAKQKATEVFSDLSFDVRRCTNAVDREIAKDSSKAAYLTELRDKAIRFNTYADFVAGGLTGILAGALEMADLSRFANTSVDIAEGAGQAGLSAWAYKAEHAGDRRQGGLPNVLAAVVDPEFHHKAYPDSVRSFLHTSPTDDPKAESRADQMVQRWKRLNFCLTHNGHKMKKHQRVKHLTGTHNEDATMTIDILEDRTAMLHDLRAEVTMMDEAVAELFSLLKRY